MQPLQNKESSIASSRAIFLAVASQEYKSTVNGRNFAYNSVFFIYSSSPRCDAATIESVNVVFQAKEKAGIWDNIVVSEDPTSSRVTNVTTQHLTTTYEQVYQSPQFSGYEFYSSSVPKTYPVCIISRLTK